MNQKLSDLFANHIIIILPTDSDILARVHSELQQFLLNGTECSWGIANDLTNLQQEAIYFPKDLNDENMFTASDEEDAPTKEQLQDFFDQIKAAGKEYTELDDFIKSLEKKSELELFILISELSEESVEGQLNNDEKVNEEELQEKIYACIACLKRYGLNVTKETFSDSEKIAEYKRWYDHWYTWMESFSDQEWEAVYHLIKDGDIQASHLPKKKWNED